MTTHCRHCGTHLHEAPVEARAPWVNVRGCFGIIVFVLVAFFIFFSYVMSRS